MRASALHSALWSYAEEAASLLTHERRSGAELPFDVIESGGARMGRTPLYCYRPMTAEFIHARQPWLALVPAHEPAVNALSEMDGLDRYLQSQGVREVAREQAGRAEAVLERLVSDLFDDSTEFQLLPERFDDVYDALESALMAGESQVEVLARVRGLALESAEFALSDGVSLVSAAAVHAPPIELTDGGGGDAVLARWIEQRRDGDDRAPVRASEWVARLLTPLRLYGDGEVGIDPVGWIRRDGGPWRELALGGRRRVSEGAITIGTSAEDELRAFCNLISRRLPRGGETAWALGRYEMACERRSAAEALSDHLLALRALLEPEGPASGHLTGRLAVLCAVPMHRRELAERVAHAVALERAVIAGLTPPESGLEAIVDELSGHLRALLRDVLCGHLDSDLRRVADELIGRELGEGEDEADRNRGHDSDGGHETDLLWPVPGSLEVAEG